MPSDDPEIKASTNLLDNHISTVSGLSMDTDLSRFDFEVARFVALGNRVQATQPVRHTHMTRQNLYPYMFHD